MTLYISDCQNYYVSPGGADGFEDQLDPNSGLLTPGYIIACKECDSSCSQIKNELKKNKVYKDVLGVGTSCGMYAKTCGSSSGQPDCPLGSHVEVDECVLNQENMQEFIRAGQTAQIVGVKCLDNDRVLNSQGLCVHKLTNNDMYGKNASSDPSPPPNASSDPSPSSKKEKSLLLGLAVGLGLFLFIFLAFYFLNRSTTPPTRVFMVSSRKTPRRR